MNMILVLIFWEFILGVYEYEDWYVIPYQIVNVILHFETKSNCLFYQLRSHSLHL